MEGGSTFSRRSRALLCAVVGCALVAAGGLVPAASASASAGPSPTIDGTTVTNITEHGATIEAQINPQGSETLYEIRLMAQDPHPPSEGERVTGGVQSQSGRLPASSEDKTVSLAVTNLQPGYAYWYVVRAGSRAGETNGKSPYWFAFHTSHGYPEGWLPNLPFELPTPFWLIFNGEDLAGKEVKEYEEKQAAQKFAERKEAEAAALLLAEAIQRQRAEAQQPATTSTPPSLPRCIVPSVKGDTLTLARNVIVKHHCRLGKVRLPHHHRGTLVVVQQTPKRGTTLGGGDAIAVTLAATRSKHPRAR